MKKPGEGTIVRVINPHDGEIIPDGWVRVMTDDMFMGYIETKHLSDISDSQISVNVVEPLHIVYFYDLYRGKKWKRFNSEKICELVYAKIQGKKDLIAHFEKGKVLSFESEEKRPLILETPNPLPFVKLPIRIFETFRKLYPYSRCSFYTVPNIPNENQTFTVESLFG